MPLDASAIMSCARLHCRKRTAPPWAARVSSRDRDLTRARPDCTLPSEPSSWYHDNNDGLALPLQCLQVQSASSGCTNEVSFDMTPLHPWPIEAQGAGAGRGSWGQTRQGRGAEGQHRCIQRHIRVRCRKRELGTMFCNHPAANAKLTYTARVRLGI